MVAEPHRRAGGREPVAVVDGAGRNGIRTVGGARIPALPAEMMSETANAAPDS